jgi:hypothetical protein
MSLRRVSARLALVSLATFLVAATEPTPETRRWWSHVQKLAGDDMEGRDTGSEGYSRAARYVTAQWISTATMSRGSRWAAQNHRGERISVAGEGYSSRCGA